MHELGTALKKPGTKLASEVHGGLVGRVLKRRCRCGGLVQLDGKEEPFCIVCGLEAENASRIQQRSQYDRLRMFKKFRMYSQG